MAKVKGRAEREYYLRATAEMGWLRNVLLNQIKADAYSRRLSTKICAVEGCAPVSASGFPALLSMWSTPQQIGIPRCRGVFRDVFSVEVGF